VTNAFHRDRFTWLAYILLAFYAYFLNILGPITPFLKEELGLSYTISSLHFTAFAVGILVVGLFGHVVIHYFGRRVSLWMGAFGISLSALLLIAGKTPVITIGASLCIGLIGSLIPVIVPSALSDQHGEQRSIALSEANVTASLVSTAAPLMVGWFTYFIGGWRLTLGAAALTPLILRLIFGKTAPPPIITSRNGPPADRQPLPAMFWVYWAAIVLAVSVEFCMIFWSADYLENSLGMQKVNSAQAVSLFLAAMIIGRLVGSRLIRTVSIYKVIIASVVLAGAGFLIFWTTDNAVLGMFGLFLTGLGVANLYPLTLSLAIGAAEGNTVLASARTTLASGVAIFALPLTLGRLADMLGIRLAYGIVAILLIGLFLIIQATARRADYLKAARP